jgi:chromosome segregation ATPase
MIFTLSIANAQSKKEQIANLNYSLDSLTEIIANERQVFKKEINEKDIEISNLNVQTDKLSSKSDSLSTQLYYKEEKLDSLANLLTTSYYQIDSLTLQTTRQSTIIDSLRSLISSTKPSNTLLFNPSSGDMKYGNSLDAENTSFEDYSEIYCSCLSAVTKVMNENKDYDEGLGGYGIELYNQLSVSEKKIRRAQEILKYNLSPAECSTFGDPGYFDVIFKREVLNLCKNW